MLASCSDYFRAMFIDPMKESRQREISLNGVTAIGIELLLDYAYTSKLELNLSNVQDVLSAASHVQFEAVVEACSNYLQTQLDLENCVDIVTIAETYSLTKLRQRVYRFICAHLHDLSKSNEFFRLSWSQLEHILACDLPVDCSESTVLKIVLEWIRKIGADLKIVHRLIHNVRLTAIPLAELERTLDCAVLPQTNDFQCFAKSIFEWRQFSSPLSSSSSNKKAGVVCDPPVTNSVVNFRGMELALIKVGGFGLSGITNEITYFLPSLNKWCMLTSIPHVEQCNYGTAVLDNELYVVGGCYNDSLEEYIHPFGFRYSPMTNKWSTISPMLQDRCRFSLNVVGQHLYAIGGVSETNNNVYNNNNVDRDDVDEDTGECYNPETDTWLHIAPLPGSRTQHAGTSVDGHLYISGGLENLNVLTTFYRYYPTHDLWEKLPEMLSPRADHVMLSIEDEIYVCGGWHENTHVDARTLNDTIDRYNAERREWEVVTTVPTPRFHAGIVAVHSKIYIIGGFSAMTASTFDRATSTVECFDLKTQKWSSVDRYPTSIWEHTCATLFIPKCRDDMEVLREEITSEYVV